MENLFFKYPQYLHLLWIIPILIIFFILRTIVHKKRLKKFGKTKVLEQIIYEYAPHKIWKKFILLILALSMIIIALARPQYLSYQEKSKVSNAEIIIALDISNSMLTRDEGYNLSRLNLAKNMLISLIHKFSTEKVGLVVFAGTAFVQIPLTDDYSAFETILQSIDPSFISKQGTNLPEALSLSSKIFSENPNKLKIIILVSDGENHEGDVQSILKDLKHQNIIVFTVGIGSPRGNVVYIGNKMLTDKDGKPVISKLNESLLTEIANQTNGKYYHLTISSTVAEQIYNNIRKLSKSESISKKQYDEKFHYFAFVALILLVYEFFILERRNRWLSKFEIFKTKTKLK